MPVGFLAASACDDRSVVCEWVVEQGGSERLAQVLDSLIAPMGEAVAILVVTLFVSMLARWLVGRAGERIRRTRAGEQLQRLGGTSRRLLTVDPRRDQRIDSVTGVARSIVVLLVWTIGVMMALAAFDVNLGPLIASAGIVGVALGFGAQSLVKDFLSGLFMLAEDQFGIGDVIDVGEAEGVVESISLRTTALRGIDGTLWHVPNGEIHRVGNMSQDWARALLDIAIAYDADVDRATEVIRTVGAALAEDRDYDKVVLEAPEILGVQELAADAVVIRLWIKTLPGEQWGVSRELRRRIKLALDEADISIPFPQRTVWLRHDEEPLGPGDDPDA